MSYVAKPLTIAVVILVLSGCCATLRNAVSAYGTVAAEQAQEMNGLLKRCVSEKSLAKRAEACNGLETSIDAYRKSAIQLEGAASANTGGSQK